MPPKAVALVGAVGLTTGWLLASLLSPPVAKLQALPERRPSQPATNDPPPAFSEQLHWRLQQPPLAPTSRRNPFVFGTRERSMRSKAGQPARDEAPAVEPPAADAVAGPPFWLSGIGVSHTPQGEVRTAVVSDGEYVHVVKTGATLGGYRVLEVTDGTVTLADAAGVQFVLRLRQ